MIYMVEECGALVGPVELPVIPGLGVQVPENSVELMQALPAPATGLAWAWVDGSAKQVVDRRGVAYSTATGVPQHYSLLGELPKGLTDKAQPSPAHVWDGSRWKYNKALADTLLKVSQERAWSAIKVERDRRTIAGMKVAGMWVQSDLFSRSQWLGLKDCARDAIAAGSAMSEPLSDSEGLPITWKMLDGSTVPVTSQLAFDVVAATTRSDMAIFAAAERHNAAMRELSDPASYDYTSGWPPAYAEPPVL